MPSVNSRVLRIHGWSLVAMSALCVVAFGTIAAVIADPAWMGWALGAYTIAVSPLLWWKVVIPGLAHVREADEMDGRVRR